MTNVREKWLPVETVRVILLPAESLSAGSRITRNLLANIVHVILLSRLPRVSRQEAESHGQSRQKAISRAQQSRQEAGDRGQFVRSQA